MPGSVRQEVFRQDSLTALRPKSPLGSAVVDASHRNPGWEVSEHPILLARLEALLEQKLREAASIADGSTGTWGPARLKLDAHRQVFDAFLHSFTTYRPLLSKVKRVYDNALEDALDSIERNISMRAELAEVEMKLAAVTEAARSEAHQKAGAAHQATSTQAAQAESQAEEAERLCYATECELRKYQVQLAATREELATLKQEEVTLREQLIKNSSWASLIKTKPQGAAVT